MDGQCPKLELYLHIFVFLLLRGDLNFYDRIDR